MRTTFQREFKHNLSFNINRISGFYLDYSKNKEVVTLRDDDVAVVSISMNELSVYLRYFIPMSTVLSQMR